MMEALQCGKGENLAVEFEYCIAEGEGTTYFWGWWYGFGRAKQEIHW